MPAPTNTANEIQSRTYGGQERVITYDEAGNVATLQAKDATDGWRYTYDYRNRLIKIESTEDITDNPVDWEEAPVALYYDGLNRRIKKDLTTGNDVVYLYDGWQCVEEREVDGGTWEMRRQYVYGGQYIDEPVLFDKDTDGDEAIDVSYWYLHDTNYNVVALADNTGSTVERCWYQPYGPTTFTNASGAANTPATESDYANTLAFQGQRLDTDRGLYYFRNRHYSPTLGRFAQRDPVEYKDGMSLYQFEMLCVLTELDALGLGPTWDEAKAGAAGGAESLGKSAASIFQTYGKILGLNTMSWEEIYANTPIGQSEGTWAELPTKVSFGVATGATVLATGGIILEASGISSIGSMSITEIIAGGSAVGTPFAYKYADKISQCITQAHKTLNLANSVGFQYHHVWAKYLGGPTAGPPVWMAAKLHAAYHAGLDKILSRFTKGGATQYFADLPFCAKQEIIELMLGYTERFDQEFGTPLYPALLQALEVLK